MFLTCLPSNSILWPFWQGLPHRAVKVLNPPDFAQVPVLPPRDSYPKNHHQKITIKIIFQKIIIKIMIFGMIILIFFVDGLQAALPSPYNVKLVRYDLLTMSNWRVTVSLQFKLARYGLLTIQTGTLRSPYNSNWRVTVSLQFKLARTVSLQFFKLVYDIFMNGYYPLRLRRPRLRQSLI